MADFNFTPPSWVDDDGNVNVWDSQSKTYVVRGGQSPLDRGGPGGKPVPDTERATGGDNDLFDPTAPMDQNGSPFTEGFMASVGDMVHNASLVCPECQQPQRFAGGKCLNCGHVFQDSGQDRLNTDTGPFNDVEPKEDLAHMQTGEVGTSFSASLHRSWSDDKLIAPGRGRVRGPNEWSALDDERDDEGFSICPHCGDSIIPGQHDRNICHNKGYRTISKTAAEPAQAGGLDLDSMFEPGVVGGKTETHRFVLDPAHNMYIGPATMDHGQIVKKHGIREFARGSVYANGTAEVNLQRMPGQLDRGALEHQLQQHIGTPVNLTYMPGENPESPLETGGSFVAHGVAATETPGNGFAWRKDAGVPSDDLVDSVALVFVAEHAETTDYPIYVKCRGGFITATGGSTSHAAVVARQSGQPCLVGIGQDYMKIGQGASVNIDGKGAVKVGPPNPKVQEYMQRGDGEWANAMDRRQNMERDFRQNTPQGLMPNRGGSVTDKRPEEQPYEIVDGQWVALSARLDECPECRDPMIERDGEKHCGSCGHRQKIMYAAVKESIPGLSQLAGDAVDALGNPVTDLEVGGLAAGAIPTDGGDLALAPEVLGGGEAADAAASAAGVSGIRGLMQQGLNVGKGVGFAGMGLQGAGQMAQMGEGMAGLTPPQGPDESNMQAQMASVHRASTPEGMWDFDFDPRYADTVIPDTEGSDDTTAKDTKGSNCPKCDGNGIQLAERGDRKKYRCRNCNTEFVSHMASNGDELGSAAGGQRIDGDDKTDEQTQGAMMDHGDSTDEFGKDVGNTGSANSYDPAQSEALEAFNSEPSIKVFIDSPESGRGDEGFERVLHQLAEAFPGAFDDLLSEGHQDAGHEHEPQHENHEDPGNGDKPDKSNGDDTGSDGSDSKLGANMENGFKTAMQPGEGFNPDAPGGIGAQDYNALTGADTQPASKGFFKGGWECPGCGEPHSGYDKFCSQCGSPKNEGEIAGGIPAGPNVIDALTGEQVNPAAGPRTAVKIAVPHRAPVSEEAKRHVPHDSPWVTDDGQQLHPQARYMMKANGYDVPDDVTIDQVTDHEIRYTVHGQGMDFPDHMSREDFDRQGGFTFELKQDAPGSVVQEVNKREQVPGPASNPGNDAGTADPGQVDDLSDLPTPVSHEVGDSVFDNIPEENIEQSGEGQLIYRDPTTGQEMNYQQYAAHLAAEAPEGMKWLWEDKQVEPVMSEREKVFMMATAGRNFTPQQQKEFIAEVGEARNLSKLNLEGTHYNEHDGSAVDPDECWF